MPFNRPAAAFNFRGVAHKTGSIMRLSARFAKSRIFGAEDLTPRAKWAGRKPRGFALFSFSPTVEAADCFDDVPLLLRAEFGVNGERDGLARGPLGLGKVAGFVT